MHKSLLTNVLDIKFDTKKLKTQKDFGKWNIMMKVWYKNKSNIEVNTAIQELSIILNILTQVEPTIRDENLTKQESKALKQLQENQNLVIRKVNNRITPVVTGKNYYWNILVINTISIQVHIRK